MKRNKKSFLMFLVVVFLSVSLFGVFSHPVKAETADEIEDEISSLEKKQKKAEAELEAENSKLYKNKTQISATQALLKKIKDDIVRREAELRSLSDRAEFNRSMLAEYLRQVYYAGQEDPVVSLTILPGDLNELSENFDGMVGIKGKIVDALQAIEDAKSTNLQAKLALADQQEIKEEALQAQKIQQAAIVDDIEETQATLQELQKKLAELESDLLAVTGNSYNAKDIKEAVEYASSKTGVPKGVLYGFLKMETNLGANTGQCTYEQVEKVAVARYKKYGSKYKKSIALLYTRRDLFYDLVDDLGYSKKKKVSCSPSGYIGQGGAMGVSQFMSDVWRAYSPQVASKTGHRTPDPWNLTDGVMAMALKLKKAGATSDSASAIKKASINYLGTYYANYYKGIVYWAKNYKTLFD